MPSLSLLILFAFIVALIHAQEEATTTDASIAHIISTPAKIHHQAAIVNNINIKDLTINIGKIDVDVDINKKKKHHRDGTDTMTAPVGTPNDDYPALYDDEVYAAEPSAEETVLGENADVSVSGGHDQEGNDISSVFSGPVIFSVTFKVQQPKKRVITMTGADLTTSGGSDDKHSATSAVSFIIRGRGFAVGGNEFEEISEAISSKKGSILEPRVFLGAIPLKVVKFDNNLIVARFEDRDDQKEFQPGTYVVRVKVLRVEREEEDEKHDHGLGGGIGGNKDNGGLEGIGSIGGLILPELGAIGGSFPSGLLGGNKGHGVGILGVNDDQGISGVSLASLFNGFTFNTAVLTVPFGAKDAEKIREAGQKVREP